MTREQKDSVYFNKRGEFKEFIQTNADPEMLVSHALQGYREISCLSSKYKNMTVGQLSQDAKLIEEVFNALRDAMEPPSKIIFSYTDKEQRKLELIQNIAGSYNIDTSRAVGKIIRGTHTDDYDRVFGYAIEVVAAPRIREDFELEEGGHVDIIGCINSTPSIDGGDGYFQGGSYVWYDKKGVLRSASSIRGILSECGFSSNPWSVTNKSKQRLPCVFYVNLLCPVLDRLGGAGKTRIDLRPFEEDIAKAVSGIAYKMPTFHGQIDYIDYDISEPVKTATDYLDEFLIQRRKDIEADPSLKITDRLTQASVFYRIRPAMIEEGFKPRKTWSITRETIQGDINNRCQALWSDEHIVREDLGIIAKPRAIMYYKGMSYPVSVDNAKSLAENGVIVIVIEKQGIADVLNTFADKYGVALVHTGGHFVEYCKDLIDAVDDSGGKIATLTDFDAAGIIIAEGARIEIPRIGIDRNTVVYFQQHGFPNLTEVDVEETYRPNVSTDIEYLQTKRIELDSILAKVRAKALWEYIEHQLLEAFPEGIDYNRVISSTPELSDPDPISEITDYFKHIQNKATTDKSEEIEQELSNVKGLLEVDQKQDEINEELDDLVNNDSSVKLLISLFEDLKAKLIQNDHDAADYWEKRTGDGNTGVS